MSHIGDDHPCVCQIWPTSVIFGICVRDFAFTSWFRCCLVVSQFSSRLKNWWFEICNYQLVIWDLQLPIGDLRSAITNRVMFKPNIVWQASYYQCENYFCLDKNILAVKVSNLLVCMTNSNSSPLIYLACQYLITTVPYCAFSTDGLFLHFFLSVHSILLSL